MHGFKSFPKKTEIPFDKGINIILGPNGSGKSNISEALCFVLGRLSMKSIRATKSSNLIFLGTSSAAPSKEAVVEIIFDNSDSSFSIEQKEISIKRIVRRNGQSIYKINDETKTRSEVLFLLAQAGIDPYGFNIILQGEIQNFVRMHTEDRRKIIEEVSGISIYESRKEKSLKELEKTEERLKEILAILRERTSYLNNLEKERQQALKFKKLESDIKKFKASIIYHDLIKKKKQAESLNTEIENKNKELEKIKKIILSLQTEITNFESKINSINSTIQKSTGLEQESLNQQIADIRAELAGLIVRRENYEAKLSGVSKKKQELNEKIRDNQLSINELQKESPTDSKEKDIENKKKELEKLEEQRKKFYTLKSELKSVRERIQDKESTLQNYQGESNLLLKHIDSISLELFDTKTTSEKLNSIRASLTEKKNMLENLNQIEVESEKKMHIFEYEIKKLNSLKEEISKINICPLCKSKISHEHIKNISSETNPKIKDFENKISELDKFLSELYKRKNVIKQDTDEFSKEISKREMDLIKLSSIEDKKYQIKSLQEKIEKLNQDLSELSRRKKFLDSNFDENSNIDEKYETLSVELREISMRSKQTINSEVSFKQRELERSKIALKQLLREEIDFISELNEIIETIDENEELLDKKRKQEEELTKKFQEMISSKNSFQQKIRETETDVMNRQVNVHGVEQSTNDLKIDKARIDAELENLEIEMLSYPDVELIKISKDVLLQKLNNSQDILSKIGTVNLRSLEVYDEVKKEYDSIKEKTEIINKEKEGILKIINEIDVRKKKVFLKTLEDLNEKFSRNFAQISTKGQVFLELENKKEPFEAGVGIVVKIGHGKYFDVTSLSGGEQTMVALSLIFAIQELSPYCFYILDEIDAALDKRNSERLASLLKKYMQKGQYIIITHNDEIITNATNLFGVSMHDGISKIISLKI